MWLHDRWTIRVCRRSCPGQGCSLTPASSAGTAPCRAFSGVQIKKAVLSLGLDMWIPAGIPEFGLYRSDKGDFTGIMCHLFDQSFPHELLQCPNAAPDQSCNMTDSTWVTTNSNSSPNRDSPHSASSQIWLQDDTAQKLQPETYLSQKPVHKHRLVLPKAINPEDALDVIGGVPRGIKDDDSVSSHQVYSQRTCFGGYDKEAASGTQKSCKIWVWKSLSLSFGKELFLHCWVTVGLFIHWNNSRTSLK